jgi:hypothetical protein
MREEKIVARLFRKVADLVADEANRNADFAKRLEDILSELPIAGAKKQKEKPDDPPAELPDIFEEAKTRGDSEFLLWLQDQPMPVLRRLIKVHDFDAAGRAARWKDPEKLAALVAEELRARMSRGSAFLKTNIPVSH